MKKSKPYRFCPSYGRCSGCRYFKNNWQPSETISEIVSALSIFLFVTSRNVSQSLEKCSQHFSLVMQYTSTVICLKVTNSTITVMLGLRDPVLKSQKSALELVVIIVKLA